MILSGNTIRERGIINPFHDRTVSAGMTFGVGPAGYDVRVEFDKTGELDIAQIASGGFMLASTIERFTMPNDVIGFVHDKSSWARKGLAVQNTVIEPGWFGYLTLEITNHSHRPLAIERGSPIAQVVFHFIDRPVTDAYNGKYQDQERGPQRAR